MISFQMIRMLLDSYDGKLMSTCMERRLGREQQNENISNRVRLWMIYNWYYPLRRVCKTCLCCVTVVHVFFRTLKHTWMKRTTLQPITTTKFQKKFFLLYDFCVSVCTMLNSFEFGNSRKSLPRFLRQMKKKLVSWTERKKRADIIPL